MNRNDIIQSLRAEITHLQKILEMMEELPGSGSETRGPGRPKGSPVKAAGTKAAAAGKRSMSAEGKARIAAAQKKRWARVNQASKPGATRTTLASKRTGSKSSEVVGSRPLQKSLAAGRSQRTRANKVATKAVKRPAKATAASASATE